MAKSVTVVPHYGRDYTSKAAVKADYEAGKDFRVQDMSSPWNGSAVNKEDAEREGLDLRIRYNKLQDVVFASTF